MDSFGKMFKKIFSTPSEKRKGNYETCTLKHAMGSPRFHSKIPFLVVDRIWVVFGRLSFISEGGGVKWGLEKSRGHNADIGIQKVVSALARGNGLKTPLFFFRAHARKNLQNTPNFFVLTRENPLKNTPNIFSCSRAKKP